ncbi:MAG: hypothetical protein WCW84_07895 [Sulfurimonas sp.]|jgi:hypothetical protein
MDTFIQWLPIIGAMMFLSTIGYVVYKTTHHKGNKKERKNHHIANFT